MSWVVTELVFAKDFYRELKIALEAYYATSN
jgi:hypothetical protein